MNHTLVHSALCSQYYILTFKLFCHSTQTTKTSITTVLCWSLLSTDNLFSERYEMNLCIIFTTILYIRYSNTDCVNSRFIGEKPKYVSTNTGLFEMIVGVLTTCHTQYTWDSSIRIFYLIEQHSKCLLHTVQVLYMCTLCDSTDINTIIDNHRWHATGSLERTRLSCWCL